MRFLPLQCLVNQSSRSHSLHVGIAKRIKHRAANRLHGGIVGYIVITRHAIGETQLQVRQPVDFLHESLFRQPPSYCCRRECPPAVAFSKLRRAVPTYSTRQHITSLIRIVSTQCIRHQAALAITCTAAIIVVALIACAQCPPICAFQHVLVIKIL